MKTKREKNKPLTDEKSDLVSADEFLEQTSSEVREAARHVPYFNATVGSTSPILGLCAVASHFRLLEGGYYQRRYPVFAEGKVAAWRGFGRDVSRTAQGDG